MNEKVYVVIPAHNESKHLADILGKTKQYTNNIIVVDDGSKDNTKEIAEKSGVTVLHHVVNLGKGSALKTGCDFAVEEGAGIIIVMDADSQHNPHDIPRLLDTLKGKDVVLSYRKMRKSMPSVLKFGNWVLNQTIKYLYGIEIKDSQCGYRAFSAKSYKKMRWKSADYSMESEMIAKIGKHKLSYAEIPIETVYSDRYKGTTVFDGVKIVFNLFLWKLNNL